MELLRPDELRERVQRSAENTFATCARFYAKVACDYGTLMRVCESPIEQLFALGWYIATPLVSGVGDPLRVSLVPQCEVVAQGHAYRIDFSVGFLPPQAMHKDSAEYRDWVAVEWPQIAIELDGHDFHERTKEQVSRRNARDRDLQLDGWTVLHFSGTEVSRDPVGVALTVARDACRLGECALYRSMAGGKV